MIVRPLGREVDASPRGRCYQLWVVSARAYVENEFYWRLHDQLWPGATPIFDFDGPRRKSAKTLFGLKVTPLGPRHYHTVRGISEQVREQLAREVYSPIRRADAARYRMLWLW